MTIRAPENDLSDVDVGGNQKDELFDVLSHPSRRFILHALQSAESPVSIDELTSELVAWEDRHNPSDRSGVDRQDLEISLVHTHLPKIANAGLADYDTMRQVVTLTDPPEEMEAYLETVTTTTGSD